MFTVRPIRDVVVVSRSEGPARALVDAARSAGADARIGTPEDLSRADVVCTCTTSPEPLFDGSSLPRGCHVNAIGSYRPTTRELDTETVRRARVVVETREVALEEAGDLLVPLGEGAIGPDHVIADLAELVRGAEVRRSPEDVTLFEGVGMAFEDLVVATAIHDAQG
jgi:ornithine cyclodeaminase